MTKQKITSISESIQIIKELQNICKAQREEIKVLKQKVLVYETKYKGDEKVKDFMKYFK